MSGTTTPSIADLARDLTAPFAEAEVRWVPAATTKAPPYRALAVPYVDARTIEDRLDQVVGVAGWQDEYQALADGAMLCRLRLRLGDEWVTKAGIGGPNAESKGVANMAKSAASDAFKRAAAKFGVGRYLYRVAGQWVDYDPQRKQFKERPSLGPAGAEIERPAPRQEPQTATAAAPAPAAGEPARVLPPADGPELARRLRVKDQALARARVCRPGELVAHVLDAGRRRGYPPDLAQWNGQGIQLAMAEVRAFEAEKGVG